jgi:tetratricopeptide (TPR) repeat protein
VNSRIVLAGMLLATGVLPASAQKPEANARVVQALPSKYTAPSCGLKTGHFKVSSGATYLKTGVETTIEENKARALASGEKVLLEAIQQNDQAKNPAAWYYLGRIYLQQGDLAGADSSLSKAEAMLPACKEEIGKLRYVAWVPLMNAGVDFAKAQNNDSALALIRQANLIYRDKPGAFLNGGVLFANLGQADSAIVYWKQAADIAERTNAVEERNTATRNLGAMYQKANRHPEAVKVLEKYLAWVPNDAEVKRALVGSYRATGQADKAQALEKEVGVTAPAGPASAVGGAASPMNAAIELYNQKKYAEAAAAFEKVVAPEPYNRDALYGLANSYLGLKSGAKLVTAATRLEALEPMNEDVLRMVATGHRLSKKEASANKAAVKALALPVTIKVTQFAPSANDATLTGTATGREAQTAAGKAIAPSPLTLVVEFLDAKGTAVANQEVQIPALKAGQSQPVQAKGQGTGIVAWRYKRK